MALRMLKNALPWIMGISASHHNAAVCLLSGNQIYVAIQEERLTGSKRAGFTAAGFINAIPYCLDAARITPRDLDLVVISTAGYPADHIENDITLNRQLRVISNDIQYMYIPHHLAHAISVYALSGLSSAAILVIDGLGSPYTDLTEGERRAVVERRPSGWEYASLYQATGRVIKCLEKHLTPDRNWLSANGSGMPYFNSFGAMYSAVSAQIFGSSLESGKVMGLAPYGACMYRPEDFYIGQGKTFIFRDTVSNAFPYSQRWPLNKEIYQNLAASVQEALQQAVLELATRLKQYTGVRSLCYAGGVALNCTTNELLHQSGLFDDILMIPASEDSGVAIGAAYHGSWELSGEHRRVPRISRDGLGVTYSETDIHLLADRYPGVFTVTHFEPEAFLGEVAKRLAAGEICGWFDGPSEIGPRALGRRSILADPRKLSTKVKLNDEIKGRESFRPLAPVIMEDKVGEWFHVQGSKTSPFMLRTWKVIQSKAESVPAVVHVDGTARVQTVNSYVEPRMFTLLKEFESITNIPMLLNTSFNAAGEPIVETPVDALWSFVGLGLDCLAINNCIVVLNTKLRSLLDLIPYISAESLQSIMPVVDGKATQLQFHDDMLIIRVPSGWGIRVYSLSRVESTVVHLVDGESDGIILMGRLREQRVNFDEKTLQRALIAMRRKGIISFRVRDVVDGIA